MIARLTAVTAAAISVVLLAPAVLLGNTASSLSIVVLGAVVLVFGVGLVVLLYLGAFSGY
jgi:hypothetical protein